MNIWINGISGRLGQMIKAVCVKSAGISYLGGFSQEGLVSANDQLVAQPSGSDVQAALASVDVVLDFSSISGNQYLYQSIKSLPASTKLRVLIGTTGLTTAQIAAWYELTQTHTQIGVLIAPNTSLGVLVTSEVAKILTKYLRPHNFDIELSETHHRHKVDAPSGTALFLAQQVVDADKTLEINTQGHHGLRKPDELVLTAQRGGGVFGEHSLRFIGDFEEVTLSHRAFSRELFAQGAVVLAQWLAAKQPGFYQLTDVELSR